MLLDDLTVTLTRQSRTGPRNPGRAAETPLPIDLRALEAGQGLKAVLAHWNRYLGGPPTVNVRAMAGWLKGHLEDARQSDRAAEFVTEVTLAVDKVRRVVDLPPDRWYAGPCDACGADLYAFGGAQVVVCPAAACDASYDLQARRDWLLQSVTDRLATTTEICRALGTLAGAEVTPSVVRGLVNRGRLESKGSDRRGNPLYRIGDVLDRIITRQQRRVLA